MVLFSQVDKDSREVEFKNIYQKFKQIIKAQGGNANIQPENIPLGKYSLNIKADKNGVVKHINNKSISKIARIAGAPKDKRAGIYLYMHVLDSVKKNDIIYTVYSNNKDKIEYAKNYINIDNGFRID